jgi:FAD/FMN-containing dehydrogenase
MQIPIGSAAQLVPAFGGSLLQSADAAYDTVRRVHNGLVDKRPALIACCRGTADVADAVKLARALGLEIAVNPFPIGGNRRRAIDLVQHFAC